MATGRNYDTETGDLVKRFSSANCIRATAGNMHQGDQLTLRRHLQILHCRITIVAPVGWEPM